MNIKRTIPVSSFILVMITALSACIQSNSTITKKTTTMIHTDGISAANTDTATLGTGCFWCTEAIFQQLKGVISATSGYSGGHVDNPTYKEVCEGTTGHAEVIQIVYDTSVISFDELLEMFWQAHDPTTLNRQGNDVGPQYRSVIFYHNNEQKEKSEKYKSALDQSKAFDNPIVTEISPFTKFYKAENYHQDYYNNNGSQPYCYYVIKPKLEKFNKVFKDKIKK